MRRGSWRPTRQGSGQSRRAVTLLCACGTTDTPKDDDTDVGESDTTQDTDDTTGGDTDDTTGGDTDTDGSTSDTDHTDVAASDRTMPANWEGAIRVLFQEQGFSPPPVSMPFSRTVDCPLSDGMLTMTVSPTGTPQTLVTFSSCAGINLGTVTIDLAFVANGDQSLAVTGTASASGVSSSSVAVVGAFSDEDDDGVYDALALNGQAEVGTPGAGFWTFAMVIVEMAPVL